MEKPFDLADRTKLFAVRCRQLVRRLPKDIANIEDSRQLVRSSGSVAANYIEANEALSSKDFVFRIKVCRKEAKESKLWLDLLLVSETQLSDLRKALSSESEELVRIFTSILGKYPKH